LISNLLNIRLKEIGYWIILISQISINKNAIKHINDQQIILQKHILDVKLMSNNYSRHDTRMLSHVISEDFFSKMHYMYHA